MTRVTANLACEFAIPAATSLSLLLTPMATVQSVSGGAGVVKSVGFMPSKPSVLAYTSNGLAVANRGGAYMLHEDSVIDDVIVVRDFAMRLMENTVVAESEFVDIMEKHELDLL